MFQVEIWGERALFSRPELKVERVSYDVITPSAARGILEAIYWHPGITWVIDKIHVMNPIRFTNIRRNEVKSKISAHNIKTVMGGASDKELYIASSNDRLQRAAMVLADVRYVIEAHFIITDKANPSDNSGKFTDIMKRRLETGKCFQQPCFGCREFTAYFRKFEGGKIDTAYPNSEIDLGLMLYDMDFTDSQNITPKFFRAIMRNGIVDLKDCEVFR